MATYRLDYKHSVEKDLKKLPKPARQAVVAKIYALAKNPRPVGYTRLRGLLDLYRVRQGSYRIIYQIHDEVLTVLIIKVGHRKDIYKRLS